MNIDPSVLTFLGGATVGAFLSGVMKICADAVKDKRDARLAHEAALRAAYEAWAGSIEEAHALSLHNATLALKDGGDSQAELLRLGFDVVEKVGAARSRLLLLEDDPALRDEVARVAKKFRQLAVMSVRADSKGKYSEYLDTSGKTRKEFDALLLRAAARRSTARGLVRPAASAPTLPPAAAQADEENKTDA